MALKLNILHTYVLYMLCGNLIFILMWFFLLLGGKWSEYHENDQKSQSGLKVMKLVDSRQYMALSLSFFSPKKKDKQ